MGLNVGYPVFAQDHWAGFSGSIGPTLGIVVDTPYGFDLGPYAVGTDFGFEMANIGGDADYTGFYLGLNSTVYEMSLGSLSVNGGGGYYMGNTNANTSSSNYQDYSSKGFGANGGIYFNYLIPNQPIVIQPYARGTFLLDIDGAGAEVATLDSIEGLQLYINPDECIECDACVPACPPDAIYEDEDTCIDHEGNDESVKKNYEFFSQTWEG